jgi:hypothetical protein
MLAPKIDELAKQQALARAKEEFGEKWSKPGNLALAFQSMAARPEGRVYSMDPWWLARYLPQLEKTAMNSLNREGFECWYPTYRWFKQTPLRYIPPKKRHMASQFITETRLPRFPGYLLIRRVFGDFDVNRLFDLEGCGSIVKSAGYVAYIEDYEVELMRLAEASGAFDAHELTSHKRFRVTALGKEERWSGQSRLLDRVDESGRTSLMVDAFGRVAHLIAGAEQDQSGE